MSCHNLLQNSHPVQKTASGEHHEYIHMEDYQVTNLSDQTQKILKPFLQDILAYCKEDILSISVIGSAVTKDFHPKYSDINTLMIVKEIKVSLFDFIAILGKRYGKKKGVCPPDHDQRLH